MSRHTLAQLAAEWYRLKAEESCLAEQRRNITSQAEWYRLKAEESCLAEQRRNITSQIAELTGHAAESSKTYSDGDWKVTVKCPMNRTMDWAVWDVVKYAIPSDLWPVEMKTEIKPSLDEKGVKWLQANDPQSFNLLSQAMTTKPGAISVTVSKKES